MTYIVPNYPFCPPITPVSPIPPWQERPHQPRSPDMTPHVSALLEEIRNLRSELAALRRTVAMLKQGEQQEDKKISLPKDW